ncbi:MAG: Hpt domain-containing protein [Gammaproteobacteria bacterium]|nr:Hpt domain-containing protein [Gammaproteobacteria bacterium]
MNNMSHIDREVYKTLCEILDDEMPSLVDEFISDASLKVEELKTLVKNNDAENIFCISHSLKSSSANFGAMLMSDICKTLETSSRSGNTEDATDLVCRLGEVLIATSDELRTLIK